MESRRRLESRGVHHEVEEEEGTGDPSPQERAEGEPDPGHKEQGGSPAGAAPLHEAHQREREGGEAQVASTASGARLVHPHRPAGLLREEQLDRIDPGPGQVHHREAPGADRGLGSGDLAGVVGRRGVPKGPGDQREQGDPQPQPHGEPGGRQTLERSVYRAAHQQARDRQGRRQVGVLQPHPAEAEAQQDRPHWARREGDHQAQPQGQGQGGDRHHGALARAVGEEPRGEDGPGRGGRPHLPHPKTTRQPARGQGEAHALQQDRRAAGPPGADQRLQQPPAERAGGAEHGPPGAEGEVDQIAPSPGHAQGHAARPPHPPEGADHIGAGAGRVPGPEGLAQGPEGQQQRAQEGEGEPAAGGIGHRGAFCQSGGPGLPDAAD